MVDFAKLRNRPPEPPEPPAPLVVIGITGHRPHKLQSPESITSQNPAGDGYDRENRVRVAIRAEIKVATSQIVERAQWVASQPEKGRRYHYVDDWYANRALNQVVWRGPRPEGPVGVTGLALGADTDAAGVWYRMGVPYVAAVPFPNQAGRWPEQSRAAYEIALRLAVGVICVSERDPRNSEEARDMLFRRDDWVVSACDELIAVFDGTPGGTAHTVCAWNKIHSYDLHRLHRIDPRDYR
jgi:uncharacterized phage-like protein YoqJ